MATPSPLRCRKIDKYDGQHIFASGKVVYELGNYLGGGASGSVYQANEPTDGDPDRPEKPVAIKILNPLGYKNTVVGQINRCPIAVKGQPLSADQIHGKVPMSAENVWWLLHPTSKQVFAAYEDPHRLQLRELPLPRCVEIWGLNPFGIDENSNQNSQPDNVAIEGINTAEQGSRTVLVDGAKVTIPTVSPKYLHFLRSRQTVCREMNNMLLIGGHPNVIAMHEFLELIQDTKTTLFLVLELINGGELFERMKTGLSSQNSPGENNALFLYELLNLFLF